MWPNPRPPPPPLCLPDTPGLLLPGLHPGRLPAHVHCKPVPATPASCSRKDLGCISQRTFLAQGMCLAGSSRVVLPGGLEFPVWPANSCIPSWRKSHLLSAGHQDFHQGSRLPDLLPPSSWLMRHQPHCSCLLVPHVHLCSILGLCMCYSLCSLSWKASPDPPQSWVPLSSPSPLSRYLEASPACPICSHSLCRLCHVWEMCSFCFCSNLSLWHSSCLDIRCWVIRCSTNDHVWDHSPQTVPLISGFGS